MITVGRPHLPDRQKLASYIDRIYENRWLTNNGPLLQEFEQRLAEYLGVENLLLVANGTLALQVAYQTLGIQQEAVTTPFSFVATVSTLKWQGIDPVFADIDPQTYCIDPAEVERAITDRTQAIVPVHVFGNGCDVEALEAIAKKHNLRLVYDAAHAFGVNCKGESMLKQGDASTLSLHATKLFHSIEGGAIVFKRKDDLERARQIINFGINGPHSIAELGINAKMNEFQAAMGLCVLDDIDDILAGRKRVAEQYEEQLAGVVQVQQWHPECTQNNAYYPVVFDIEEQLFTAKSRLEQIGAYARRYFYPSLGTLEYVQPQSPQPVSRDISKRVLCLPLYSEMTQSNVQHICSSILSVLRE